MENHLKAGNGRMPERSGDAAVALIINDGHILLIKRASRDDDPWSGQIALPGGFQKSGETSVETAIRESFEETNVRIGQGQMKMELEIVHPMRSSAISVHPILFEVEHFDGARPGPEVADIKIAKLGELERTTINPQNRDAYLYDGWVIWGMTYRILSKFLNDYRFYGETY